MQVPWFFYSGLKRHGRKSLFSRALPLLLRALALRPF
jgi:hypothetical protein